MIFVYQKHEHILTLELNSCLSHVVVDYDFIDRFFRFFFLLFCCCCCFVFRVWLLDNHERLINSIQNLMALNLSLFWSFTESNYEWHLWSLMTSMLSRREHSPFFDWKRLIEKRKFSVHSIQFHMLADIECNVAFIQFLKTRKILNLHKMFGWKEFFQFKLHFKFNFRSGLSTFTSINCYRNGSIARKP